jgi:hypothetical protein
MSETLESLVAYCRENDRVCPLRIVTVEVRLVQSEPHSPF